MWTRDALMAQLGTRIWICINVTREITDSFLGHSLPVAIFPHMFLIQILACFERRDLLAIRMLRNLILPFLEIETESLMTVILIIRLIL